MDNKGWEPQVGDRVRYKDAHTEGVGTFVMFDCDWPMPKGIGGYLVKVEEKDRNRAYYEDETCRWFPLAGLAPVWETPKFKFGDRVRFTDKCVNWWWFGPMKEANDGVIVGHGIGGHRWRVEIGGRSVFVNDEHIELMPPATAAPEFKPGDRVRFTNKCLIGCRFGPHTGIKDGVITAPLRYGHKWEVATSNGKAYVNDVQIDLMPPEPTATAIVCLLKNGAPRPSQTPVVHGSVADAEAEAVRLAVVHRGNHFGVFVLTGPTAFAPRHYDRTWHRLAASGDFDGAAAEIKDATGISMVDARRAAKHWAEREVKRT